MHHSFLLFLLHFLSPIELTDEVNPFIKQIFFLKLEAKGVLFILFYVKKFD